MFAVQGVLPAIKVKEIEKLNVNIKSSSEKFSVVAPETDICKMKLNYQMSALWGRHPSSFIDDQ